MKKKICIAIACIILLGTVIISTVGLRVSLDYTEYTMVLVLIDKDFKTSDIKDITNQVYPNQEVIIERCGDFKDIACIRVDGTSEEQVEQLNQKINEKFGLENKIDDIEKIKIPKTKLRDVLKPYIIPVIISTILILGYMGIRFKKKGALEVILSTGILLIIGEWLLLSIIAMTRYPVNRTVIPAALVLYFTIIIFMNLFYSKVSTDKNMENKKNK